MLRRVARSPVVIRSPLHVVPNRERLRHEQVLGPGSPDLDEEQAGGQRSGEEERARLRETALRPSDHGVSGASSIARDLPMKARPRS